MKITCSKKDDILRQKAEYEAKKAKYDEMYDEAEGKWNEAHYDIYTPVKEYIVSQLSRFNLLSFDVSVHRGWSGRGLEVRIQCNERNIHSDAVALAWNYDVKMDDLGKIVRDTGSWSGLKATTQEQIDSLKQSVEAIETIYNFDWDSLINKEMPNRKDYFTEELYLNAPKSPETSWEKQLEEAEIEDAIGTNTWFKCEVKDSESGRWRGFWVNFVKATPKRYFVDMVNTWRGESAEQVLERIRDERRYKYIQQIAKHNVSLSQPIEKVEA